MAFSFGGVFGRFFKLIGENFALFSLLGLIGTVLPALAVNYGLFTYFGVTQITWAQNLKTITPDSYVLIGGGVLLLGLLSVLNLSMVTEIAILRAVGKKANISAILGHGFSNILPIIGVSILTALILMGGFLLLLIPGLIWMICTCVSIPAYIGQPGIGIRGSISRSFELTRNHRWMLLLIFFVAALIEGAIGGTFNVFTRYTLNPVLNMVWGTQPDTVVTLIQVIFSSIANLLSNIFIVAVYVCLRESKDKATPSQTAAVFD